MKTEFAVPPSPFPQLVFLQKTTAQPQMLTHHLPSCLVETNSNLKLPHISNWQGEGRPQARGEGSEISLDQKKKQYPMPFWEKNTPVPKYKGGLASVTEGAVRKRQGPSMRSLWGNGSALDPWKTDCLLMTTAIVVAQQRWICGLPWGWAF